MSLFIVGDVHGCFFTFKKLLEQWEPKRERLIQLGDLIDRGTQSPQTLRMAFEIQNTFKNSVTFLKGNHEQMMIQYFDNMHTGTNWLVNGGNETLAQFGGKKKELTMYLEWTKKMPLFWENKNVFVSHAGISDYGNAFAPNNPYGVLWNRKPLQNIGKLQVIGHTPRQDGKPHFSSESKSWNIDTGAYKGFCLTGIKLKNDGSFLETISIPTDPLDLEYQ